VNARALVKAKGPAKEPLVSLHIVSTSDSSLGSAGTMEKAWRDADVHKVTSRDGSKGNASMEMFFSDFRAFTKASAAEADNLLTRVEKVNRVSLLSIFCNLVLSW
jgi:hypothetical protein